MQDNFHLINMEDLQNVLEIEIIMHWLLLLSTTDGNYRILGVVNGGKEDLYDFRQGILVVCA